MTVSTSTGLVQYNTNATTGPWTVPFYFLEDSHLTVTHTDSAGIDTALVLDVGYTVTGAGDQAGGTVTTTTAYASGGLLTIKRDVPATQETDYVETDPFPAEAHERALDKLTMLAQQTETTLAGTLRVPEVSGIPELPVITGRANKVLGFDEDGDPTLLTLGDELPTGAAFGQAFVATEDQTAFTLSSAVSYASVYINGLRLLQSEHTLTTSTLVTLDTGAAEYDDVFIAGILV